eukprot:gene26786-32366_t
MSFSKPQFSSGFHVEKQYSKRKHSDTLSRSMGSDAASASNLDPSRNNSLRASSNIPGRASSSNMFEVKTIFNRVDQVFKERKEETVRLMWEISDLENQLDYLRSTTQEHCDNSASLAANMSMVRGAADKVQDGLEKIRSEQFVSLQEEVNMCKEQESEVLRVIDYSKERSKDWLSRRIKLVEECEPVRVREERREDDLIALMEGCLLVQEELAAKLFINLELDQLIHDEEIELHSLRERKSQSGEELCMQREDILSTHFALQQNDHEKRQMMSLIDHKKATAVELHNTLLSRQQTSFLDAQRIQLEIQHAMQHIEQLRLEQDYQKHRFHALRQQRDRLEKEVKEGSKSLSSQMDCVQALYSEHKLLTEDLARVIESGNLAQEEVSALAAVVERCNRENEASYDLICERLKQIKEFQLQEPLLKHELMQNKGKLEEAKAVLDLRCLELQQKLDALLIEQSSLEEKVNESRKANENESQELSRLSARFEAVAEENSRLVSQLEGLHIEQEAQGRIKQMMILEGNRFGMLEEDFTSKEALLAHINAEAKMTRDQFGSLKSQIDDLEKKLATPLELSEEAKANVELETEQEMERFMSEWQRQHGKDIDELKECIAKLDAGAPINAHPHLLSEIANLEKRILDIKAEHMHNKESILNQNNQRADAKNSSNLSKKIAIAELPSIASNFANSSSRPSRKFSGSGSQPSQHFHFDGPTGYARAVLAPHRPRSNSEGSNSLSKASLEDLFVDDNSTL